MSLAKTAVQGIIGLCLLAAVSAPLPTIQASLGEVANLVSSAGGEEKIVIPNPAPSLLEKMTQMLKEDPQPKGEKESRSGYFTVKNTHNSLFALVDVNNPGNPALFYYNWRTGVLDIVLSIALDSFLKVKMTLKQHGEQKLQSPIWVRNLSLGSDALIPKNDCKFTKGTDNSKSSFQLTCTNKKTKSDIKIQDVLEGEINFDYKNKSVQ